MNTFNDLLRVTGFGESHGPAVGAVVDGVPAGIVISEQDFQKALDRRRPGKSRLTSARAEADQCEILSGIYDGKTLGSPICVLVRNTDARSGDYFDADNKPILRPGHGDRAFMEKYGHHDPRGGGRASGRETIARVIGGVIAEKIVPGCEVSGFICQMGDLRLASVPNRELVTRAHIDSFESRIPDAKLNGQATALIESLRESGDSVGAQIILQIANVPQNLGSPVFKKLKSELARAMMSVGATDSVALGDLRDLLEEPSASPRGFEFHHPDQKYGGIVAGISTGDDIYLRIGVKPTSSIRNIAKKGRHDPCIAIRMIPVLEAMAYLVVAEASLASRLDRIG
jgi:chorismate synthase